MWIYIKDVHGILHILNIISPYTGFASDDIKCPVLGYSFTDTIVIKYEGDTTCNSHISYANYCTNRNIL